MILILLRISALCLGLALPAMAASQSVEYDQVAAQSGNQTAIEYLSAEDPVPEPGFTSPDQQRNSEPEAVDAEIDLPTDTLLVGLAVAVLAAFLVALFGQGRSRIGFAHQSDAALARENEAAAQAALAPLSGHARPSHPDDPSAALVALTREMLILVARAHAMRLQPSWTLRDILARVPLEWPHRSALAALIGDCEHVLFRAAQISPDRLAEHQAALAPARKGAR